MKKRMKASRFVIILSVAFILIGFCGSIFMTVSAIQQSRNFIEDNTKMVTKEVYAKEGKLAAVDLRDLPIDDLTIEKSSDGLNHLEITYNQKAYNVSAEFDRAFPEKLNLLMTPLKEMKFDFSAFDFIKQTLMDVVYGHRWQGQSALIGIPLPQIKVSLRLTDSAEVLVRNKNEIRHLKIDEKLISTVADLRYNNYLEETAWQTLSKSLDVVHFDDDDLYLTSSRLFRKDFSITPNAKDKLHIEGSPQSQENADGKVELDLTHVKVARIDLDSFYKNLTVLKAQEVEFDVDEAVPTIIEYQVNGEKKSYRIDRHTLSDDLHERDDWDDHSERDDRYARDDSAYPYRKEQIIRVEAETIILVNEERRYELKSKPNP